MTEKNRDNPSIESDLQEARARTALEELAATFRDQIKRYGGLSLPQTFSEMDRLSAELTKAQARIQELEGLLKSAGLVEADPALANYLGDGRS
jgi:hypothetical protein